MVECKYEKHVCILTVIKIENTLISQSITLECIFLLITAEFGILVITVPETAREQVVNTTTIACTEKTTENKQIRPELLASDLGITVAEHKNVRQDRRQ